VLTLKPFVVIGKWSLCIYMSQFMVWGSSNYLMMHYLPDWVPDYLGMTGDYDEVKEKYGDFLIPDAEDGGMTIRGRGRTGLPEWTRHVMVFQLVVVSGVIYNLVEQPLRKLLNRRIDEAWKPVWKRELKGLVYTLGQVNSKEAERDGVCGKCGSDCSSALKFCTKCGATVDASVQYQEANDESIDANYPVCGICSTVSPFPNAKHCCKCGAGYGKHSL
jgi:hypothetical protein